MSHYHFCNVQKIQDMSMSVVCNVQQLLELSMHSCVLRCACLSVVIPFPMWRREMPVVGSLHIHEFILRGAFCLEVYALISQCGDVSSKLVQCAPYCPQCVATAAMC